MVTEKTFAGGTNTWININASDITEEMALHQEYGIDEEIISYALDKNERARFEYDADNATLMLIYNVAKKMKRDNHYEAVPMTFLIKEKRVVTISNPENEYIIELMKNYLKKNDDVSVLKFVLASLFVVTDNYFPQIEEMNKERNRLNHRLRKKTTKKSLLGLSDLETGVTYYVSATKQNIVLLEQLKVNSIYRLLDESEQEQLDDTLIEAGQLVEMTKLSSQVLQQLSGTYNNILNNNLNDTMKTLTVLSILMTIPTIVTGFFGMNMPLPLEHNIWGWVIAIGISLIGWFILSFILHFIIK